uniref:Uncharacterized protein n=1 Tax=Strongyloides stercoralis TaxID=6248 RepID=A0AAF5DAE7_STRER
MCVGSNKKKLRKKEVSKEINKTINSETNNCKTINSKVLNCSRELNKEQSTLTTCNNGKKVNTSVKKIESIKPDNKNIINEFFKYEDYKKFKDEDKNLKECKKNGTNINDESKISIVKYNDSENLSFAKNIMKDTDSLKLISRKKRFLETEDCSKYNKENQNSENLSCFDIFDDDSVTLSFFDFNFISKNEFFASYFESLKNTFFMKTLDGTKDKIFKGECKNVKDIMSNFTPYESEIYSKYLVYYAFILETVRFFKSNNTIIDILNTRKWNINEAFKKPTITIVGDQFENNAKFISYLLKKPYNDILDKITKNLENNISFFIPNKIFNKKGPFGELEQNYTDMKKNLFPIFCKSQVDCTAFNDSIFLEKYNLLHLNNSTDKENSQYIEINEYIFKTTDVTTIIFDESKIDQKFMIHLEKLKSHLHKSLFIMNVSNPSISKNDLSIKKEILRWLITDKAKSCEPTKIIVSNLTSVQFTDEKINEVIKFDMKCLNDWLILYQSKALYNRFNDIKKHFVANDFNIPLIPACWSVVSTLPKIQYFVVDTLERTYDFLIDENEKTKNDN